MPADILHDALLNALDQFPVQKTQIAILNACGKEEKSWDRQSYNANISVNNTLKSDYNTILIRASRQTDETIGLIALAVQHAAPGAHILVAQENRHGATSLEKRVKAGFTTVQSLSKFKCRVLLLQKDEADSKTMARWADKAAIQRIMDNTGWSCPGLFSWDRIDVGSKILADCLPDILAGNGADLGCGYGYLSAVLSRRSGIKKLTSVDLDSRAVECCRRNVAERAPDFVHEVLWRDVTTMTDLAGLDWVVMNPPFHTQLDEDRELGKKFCEAALKMLRSKGNLYMVANRHLPYESVLKDSARTVDVLADEHGFKILHVLTR